MTHTSDFPEKLAARQAALGHGLCVGLDPDVSKIPDRLTGTGTVTDRILWWMTHVVDQTADHATMYKPNAGYWERHGSEGVAALEKLLQHIRLNHPDTPVCIDGKRGDIDRTQWQYRAAMFDALGCDTTNVSPYMGREPLLCMHDRNHPGRCIITLIYTSNQGARQVQDVLVVHPETGEHVPYWYYMAECSIGWATEGGIKNLGFVMAAAHEKNGKPYDGHLRRCRELDAGKIFYLMPGFGIQGGFLEASVYAAWAGFGSVAFNASSSIANDPDPKKAAQVMGDMIGGYISAL